jgi:hypothetical protein
MRQAVDVVTVIPVGPNDLGDYVVDTIDSAIRYAGGKVIVVDDSSKGLGQELQARVPGIDVVMSPGSQGGHGGLYMTLSLGYLHAVKHYDFQVLLKLDTDALVIGPRPQEQAIAYFAEHPDVGIIGLLHHRDSPSHYARSRLKWETHPRHLREDVSRWLTMTRLLSRAQANGFALGDYAFGGAYFMSAACVRKLAEAKLLLVKAVGRSLLGEDHLFGLMAGVVGMRVGDFASGSRPMALELGHLPCSPDDLVAQGKKVTHSVRQWQGQGESAIRQFFRARRTQVKA